jgi:hypothetical protein
LFSCSAAPFAAAVFPQGSYHHNVWAIQYSQQSFDP